MLPDSLSDIACLCYRLDAHGATRTEKYTNQLNLNLGHIRRGRQGTGYDVMMKLASGFRVRCTRSDPIMQNNELYGYT